MSKALFYYFNGSIWAAAPALAIRELGYPKDAIETRILNLVEGENFNPEFIKINPNATLPTLVADGKVYKNTVEVVKYLIDNAPKAPGKVSGTDLIEQVHRDDIDPNFALLLSRDDAELANRGQGVPGLFLSHRQAALQKIAPTPAAQQFADFYKEKLSSNGFLNDIYAGKVKKEVKEAFYAKSTQHVQNVRNFVINELPKYLPQSGFIGGDKPGEDDFHLGAWLARIALTLGDGDIAGLAGDNQQIPPRVLNYYSTWSSRDSWKEEYAEGLH